MILIVALQGIVIYWRSGEVQSLLQNAFRSSLEEKNSADDMILAASKIRLALAAPEFPPGGEIDGYLRIFQGALRKARSATAKSAEAYGATPAHRTKENTDAALLKSISDGLGTFERRWREVLPWGGASETAELRGILDQNILPMLFEYHSRSRIDMAEESSRTLDVISGARIFMLSTALICAAVAAIAVYFLNRDIVRPLARITAAAKAISAGDRRQRVSLDRNDEFGELSSAFNTMLDSLQAASLTRDQLESKVDERTRELDRFFDLSLDMLCIADLSGRFLKVNKAFEETLGYHDGELLSRPFVDFVHPDDLEATRDEMKKYRDSGLPSVHFENRYRHKDGTWLQFSWNAVPVPSTGLVYGAARDVTDLMKVRELLQHRTERTLRFQEALLTLRDSEDREPAAFFKLATEECAHALGVERVSIWLFDEENSGIECRDLFELTPDRHSSGQKLMRTDYPAYFEAISQLAPVVADKAREHASTKEFTASYLVPLDIVSMLDVPLRAGGRFTGVICCEQIKVRREWLPEELKFVGAVASSVMLAMEHRERTIAEEKLRASEEYNRSIVLSSEDCLKVLSPEGRLLFMAESSQRLMAVKNFKEIENSPWDEYWTGDDRHAASHAVAEAAAGRTCRFQGLCPTFAGEPKWWDVIVSPIRGPDGRTARILAVSRDITQQRATQEELRVLNATLEQRIQTRTEEMMVAEERFRLMVEQLQDYAIFMLDAQGLVTTWNAAAERAKGYTSDEIIGRHFSTFHTSEDIQLDLPGLLLREASASGHVTNEGWRVRKDGSRFWAEVTITVLRGNNGEMHGFAKITRDLTDKRNAEDALKQSLEHQRELTRKARAGENAKSEFLAIMSHEVRTPMNGIIGYADLLAQASSLSPEHRDYALTLCQSGRALLRILDDILDFSSSEAGNLKIEEAPFSPQHLLRDVQQVLLPTAGQKGLALLVEVSPELPRSLMGDEGRLRQILLNLAGNAVKFTATGSVTLRAYCLDDGWMAYSVRDTGPGIPPQHQQSIFEPFRQADASTSRRYGGTGLGLAISRRLADLMGGSLTLHSEVEVGAEFVMRLPIMASTAEPAASLLPAINSESIDFAVTHPLRILVAEDDRINLKLTLTLLQKLGYHPLSATNGREALDIFRAERPSCILMDLQMPEMDGIEATQAIRKFEKGAANSSPAFIVALTANTVSADRDRCFRAGISAYLNKPIRRDQLHGVLADASQSTDGPRTIPEKA